MTLKGARCRGQQGFIVSKSKCPNTIFLVKAPRYATLTGSDEKHSHSRAEQIFVESVGNIVGAAEKYRQLLDRHLAELESCRRAQLDPEHRLRNTGQWQSRREISRVCAIGRLAYLQWPQCDRVSSPILACGGFVHATLCR